MLTKENVTENQSVRDFFSALVSQHLDKASPGARLDFLACNLMLHTDGGGLDKELEAFVGVRPKKNTVSFSEPLQTLPFWAYTNFYAPNFEKVDGAYCFWSVRG